MSEIGSDISLFHIRVSAVKLPGILSIEGKRRCRGSYRIQSEGISELFMQAVDDGRTGCIFVLEGEGGAFKG